MHLGGTGIKISGIIFDLDGTLINSAPQIIEAVRLAREDLGFPHIDEAILASKIGLPAKELFSDLNLDEVIEANYVGIFRKHLKEITLTELDLFKDVGKLLEDFKKASLRLAVATNKPFSLAQKALTDSSIRKYFDAIVGADVLPPKPNPAVIIEAIKLMEVDTSLSVMVGDRIEDIQAASSLKIKSVGVAQGTHSMQELAGAGANLVFNNISDMYKQVNRGDFFENLQ